MQNLIDAPELKRLLSSDQETGEFRWRVSRRGHVKAGDLAGTSSPDGYRRIFINGKPYLAHRLAWFYIFGEWPETEIDHKNTDHGDNSISNLRKATRSQNEGNKSRRADNTSGYKGVRWRNDIEKYEARIRIAGK